MNTNQPSQEAIAFAHKRAFRLTAGKSTYAEHMLDCSACAAVRIDALAPKATPGSAAERELNALLAAHGGQTID